jgi:hypothetical protein
MFMVVADWVAIHEEIMVLGRDRARRDRALGRALLRARRGRVWEPLGMASFGEYAERTLGLTPRQTEERTRVAEALEKLPALDAALEAAELHFTAVREITRVATPETEEHWVRVARDLTVGQIETLVAGRRPGDRPDDIAGPGRRRLVFDVSPTVYALFRDASAALRRQASEPLDREDLLMLMCRSVLGGPMAEGRSGYQIRMTMCERCGYAEQEGRGESVVVEPAVAAEAECDAQRIDAKGHATQDIPPMTRRLVVRRQHGRCGVPGCRNATFTHVHHVTYRSDGGSHNPDGLVVLCSAHHRAVHKGRLRIEGLWSTGFRYLTADGLAYGSTAQAKPAVPRADVVSALQNVGSSRSDVRGMDDAVAHMGADVTYGDALQGVLDGDRADVSMARGP